VTGAARAGAAEAESLAREGATVVAADVTDEASESLYPSENTPGAVHYRRLDVSRPEDWSDLAGWVEREHELVDGLVNNAGITHRARLSKVELADVLDIWLAISQNGR
jgi:3alpha(or 20beta)-hydroxysteroid dehydrogenase